MSALSLVTDGPADQLVLGPGLALPLDAMTQTIAILGNRGSGKTNSAGVLVEELLARGQQVVIIDPLDVWWGLKSSADGRHAGYPITVLGGAHGDLPLTKESGRPVADAIVEHGISAILSLRHLSKADQRRLVTDVAERLYERKGEADRQHPVLVVIDECDAFVPQKVFSGQERMVGAIDDLVRRGRASGIGVVLISQRAAVVNKDVLTQLELLIAHRHTSPQDRKALDAWVEAHDTGERRAEFLRTVAGLPVGTAWVWSPGWLDVFERVKVRKRRTFDSSATPKVGERRTAPKQLAAVDLARLEAQLAQSIEQARANDPAELRRQLAQAERRIRELEQRPASPERVEVPALSPAAAEALGAQLEQLRAIAAALGTTAELLQAGLARAAVPAPAPQSAPKAGTARPTASRPTPAPRAPTPPVRAHATAEAVSSSQQRILDALAWLEALGLAPADKVQLALIAGQRPTSGGYKNNLGRLRSAGFLDYPAAGQVALTADGRAAADTSAVPCGPEELRAQVQRIVSGSQWRILEALILAYPAPLEREDLARRADQLPTSGGYKNNLGKLRTLGLIDYPAPGQVVAQPVLFLEGR